ncbi:hypothetical protein TNCV_4833781 [Trichonephila clavipes]|nr:hypothetical protein TNCV_4833781 [Trichonephila clavipes]
MQQQLDRRKLQSLQCLPADVSDHVSSCPFGHTSLEQGALSSYHLRHVAQSIALWTSNPKRWIATTNQKAPLTVRSFVSPSRRQGYGTPSGTEVPHLTQQPIATLLTTREGSKLSHVIPFLTITATNSCYPIGKAD